MRAITQLMVAAMLVMMGAVPVLAHREPGTGGKVWVTESRPNAGYLVVHGQLRQQNQSDAELTLRCRIEVRTTEGRTGATWRRIAVEPNDVVTKKWRVLVTDSDPSATASDVDVRHCHAVA